MRKIFLIIKNKLNKFVILKKLHNNKISISYKFVIFFLNLPQLLGYIDRPVGYYAVSPCPFNRNQAFII